LVALDVADHAQVLLEQLLVDEGNVAVLGWHRAKVKDTGAHLKQILLNVKII